MGWHLGGSDANSEHYGHGSIDLNRTSLQEFGPGHGACTVSVL